MTDLTVENISIELDAWKKEKPNDPAIKGLENMLKLAERIQQLEQGLDQEKFLHKDTKENADLIIAELKKENKDSKEQIEFLNERHRDIHDRKDKAQKIADKVIKENKEMKNVVFNFLDDIAYQSSDERYQSLKELLKNKQEVEE